MRGPKCSREMSRVGRSLARKLTRGKNLPSTCPLLPEHDMYYADEQHKKGVRWNLWRCKYCGKSFESEEYLDKHFDRKHGPINGTFCMADLCDALDCSSYPNLARSRLSGKKGRRLSRKSERRAARFASSCPEDIQGLRDRCRTIFGDCGLVDTAPCDNIKCVGGRVVSAYAPVPSDYAKQSGRSPVLIFLYLIFLVVFYSVFYAQVLSPSSPWRQQGQELPPKKKRRKAARD